MSTATKSGFAREHDVSRMTIARWIRRGYAVENDEGLIERETSNEKLAGRPQVYRGGKLGGNSRGSPWASNGHDSGELRTAEEWDVELVRKTIRGLKAAGKKFVSVAEFVTAANAVLTEWRDDNYAS